MTTMSLEYVDGPGGLTEGSVKYLEGTRLPVWPTCCQLQEPLRPSQSTISWQSCKWPSNPELALHRPRWVQREALFEAGSSWPRQTWDCSCSWSGDRWEDCTSQSSVGVEPSAMMVSHTECSVSCSGVAGSVPSVDNAEHQGGC